MNSYGILLYLVYCSLQSEWVVKSDVQTKTMARIHFLTYLLLLGYMIGVANTLSTDVGKATCDNSDADM